MNLKATKAILLATVFNVLIYIVHSSISNLGKVDLLSGDFKKSAEEKLVQYRKAQNETKLEFEDSKNVQIRKCCQESYVFNDALECILDETQDPTNFFPNSMIIDENFNEVAPNISLNIDILETKNHCNDQAILFKDGDPLNYFIIQETGDLVQLDSLKVTINYTKFYCLDVAHNNDQRNFVLMLCPCEEILCIKKCCPMGQYYNTATNMCAKTLQEHEQWKLDFYRKEDKLNDTVNHFIFNKPLNCSGNPGQLINNLREPHDLLVQENGTLWHNTENGSLFTEPISYCVDMFSDGNNTHTNGFFCNATTPSARKVREKLHTVNKCCRDGESLTKKFKCQSTPKNVEHVPPPRFMADAVSEMEYTNFMVPTGYLSIKLKTKDFTQQSYKRRKINFTVKDIFENYDYSMFCIDEYHHGNDSDFGVIFTPCKTELCLQKCCPPGHYYDYNENGCRMNSAVSKQNIEVNKYKGFREVGRATEYFLIYSEPDCRGFEKPLFNNIGYSYLQIQENGDIVKEKEQYSNYVWTHPLRYCVDIFSDGEISLANGFFCAEKSSKERRILAKEGYIMPPQSGFTGRRSIPAADTATESYVTILLLCLSLVNLFYYYYL